MGLEAGWNCHICLRSEHSTDANAAAAAAVGCLPGPLGATMDCVSQGYASMLGSIMIESVPDLSMLPQNTDRLVTNGIISEA